MFSLYGQFVKLAGFYVGVSSDVAVLSWLLLGLPPALSQRLLLHTLAIDPTGHPFENLIAVWQMSGAIPVIQTFDFKLKGYHLVSFSMCFFVFVFSFSKNSFIFGFKLSFHSCSLGVNRYFFKNVYGDILPFYPLFVKL